MHGLHQQKFFYSATFSVTFQSRILAQNFPMRENFTRIIQKTSKILCQFFANSAQILYKFSNSVQILKFCTNSVQILYKFSNSVQILYKFDRISSQNFQRFHDYFLHIFWPRVFGGRNLDKKVTEKCPKNCTERQNFCQCSQTIRPKCSSASDSRLLFILI